MKKILPPVYLITDRHQIQNSKNYFDVIAELLAAGLQMIQLREKDLSAADLYDYALRLRQLTQKHQALLLVNDRIDIALAVQADGVHLGQKSLPAATARKLLGAQAIIGVSTHNQKEAQTAQQQGADFITFGPVFYTSSKAQYGEPVGIESLRHICTTTALPVYALGGIKTKNIKQIKDSGIHGIAAISTLLAATNAADSLRQCHSLFVSDSCPD